ncbi:MAG TPA: hypothetical protein VGY30_05835 [Solirubrobacteraceae bacterium]|jgi:hypothetical protein|nr:hypothetical protein [Solirubrobacteraceae bacterium]
MDRPVSLIGKTAGGAYICKDWELRVTARCLGEDLNASTDADFESVRGLEIVKAFIGTHTDSPVSTRQVSPLTCGHEVWVVGYGDDHRGGSLHDPEAEVIWLLAYRRHRSGAEDDFFPYCRELDRDGLLLPKQADYARMYRERDRRFAEAVIHEAPVILREARATAGEYRCTVGGELGVGLTVEVDDELEAGAMTVAFQANKLETFAQGQLLLAALHKGPWEMTPRMPSRDLEPGEVAYTIISASGEAQ